MFFLGNASGHDIQFHLASWMDASAQWREGVIYPRWAEWANWGFGEPRFVFYPPASWMAGAALGSLLPWRVVPGAFIWLTLVLAAISMWKFSREWLPEPWAIVAALLYEVNPYHLVIVYYRSDFAELLAGAFFPLLIWGALRAAREGWRYVPALAVVFGMIWFSNAPAAVIATYSVTLTIVVCCAVRRSFRPLAPGVTAILAGFGLAACYILPAGWEQRWVQIAEAVSEDLQPARNFLFTHATDLDFVAFNWKVSWVATGVMIVTAIAAFFVIGRRREFGVVWWILATLGMASALLMFPASVWFWRTLPKMQFVQFPWRWLEVLNFVFAFFVATAMAGLGNRKASWALAVCVFIGIGIAATAMVRTAWWDDEDVPAIATAISSNDGYEGTDEYMPIGGDRFQLPGNTDDTERPAGISSVSAELIEKIDPKSGASVPATDVTLRINRWSAEHRAFAAKTATPVTLALRLVNYPAWDIYEDGSHVNPVLQPATSQILLPLSAGEHRIELNFRRTWDRTTGGLISALTVLGLAGLAGATRRRRSHRGASGRG